MSSPAAKFIQEQVHKLAVTRRTLGEDHPEVADILNGLALFHHHVLCNNENSLQLHTQALDILRRANEESGAYLVQIAVTLTDIANTYRSMGNREEAQSCYVEALKLFRDTNLPDIHPAVYSASRGEKLLSQSFRIQNVVTPAQHDALAAVRKTLPDHGGIIGLLDAGASSGDKVLTPHQQQDLHSTDNFVNQSSNVSSRVEEEEGSLSKQKQKPSRSQSITLPMSQTLPNFYKANNMTFAAALDNTNALLPLVSKNNASWDETILSSDQADVACQGKVASCPDVYLVSSLHHQGAPEREGKASSEQFPGLLIRRQSKHKTVSPSPRGNRNQIESPDLKRKISR